MTSKRTRPTEAKGRDLGLGLLAGAGVTLSGYPVLTAAGHAPLYCSSGTGCDIVQSSRFGTLFGLPVSVFGLLFYGLLLLLALRPLSPGTRWPLVSPLASAGAAALAVVVFIASGYDSTAPQESAGEYAEGLARHLASTGVRFYGAYIECDPRAPTGRPQLCAANQVHAFPTWDIQGKRYEGVLSLEDLARLAGYRPPAGEQTP